MLSWIALFCLLGAIFLLAVLSLIDLRTRLLPNELVLGFATLGIVFHLTTLSQFLSPQQIAIGAIVGFSIPYAIRAAANKIYGQDALGLGDVKLIAASGLWLGAQGAMLALTLGALAAVLHGLGFAIYDSVKNKNKLDLGSLQVPAGPGLAIGIVISGVVLFKNFSIGS